MSKAVVERAVLLGERRSLVGIFARPAEYEQEKKPAILILNTGIIHRVGHNRMYVALARMLARLDHMVLRFDFSGIGDSEPRADDLSPWEGPQEEIREALDWLERTQNARSVVLIGLCSGADHAVLYGHKDKRIVGLVIMDPSVPATRRYYMQYVMRRIVYLRSWLNVILGRSLIMRLWAERLLAGIMRVRTVQGLNLEIPQVRSIVERAYQNAVDRGVHILAIFTAGIETTRQTYREQMTDGFAGVQFKDKLQLEFFADSDHTFSSNADRSKLAELLVSWLSTTKFTATEREPVHSPAK
jgi:pimeloyl-ACP methyl ester carboxylesterase